MINKEDYNKIKLIIATVKRQINPSLDNLLYQEWCELENRNRYPFRDFVIDKAMDKIRELVQENGSFKEVNK